MRQKGQLLQFSDQEIDLLQSVFGGDDEAVYLLRKLLFQFELTDAEEGGLRFMNTPELKSTLKKIFVNEFECDGMDTPIGQYRDFLWYLTEGGVFSRDIKEMELIFKSKKLEMDYLKQQLDNLDVDNAEEDIKFEELSNIGSIEKTYVNLIARNHLMKHIEDGLVRIIAMAHNKKEVLEQKGKQREEAIRGK